MEFIDALLLASLAVLVAGAFLPKKYGFRVAAVGWVIFGIRWLLALPEFYFVEHNIMYSAASLLALPATLYMALLMIRDRRESLMVVTRAAAISSIFYFPFATIPPLGDWLMGATASVVLAIVVTLGQPAVLQGLNDILLKGRDYQIILACTAIQSMALFVGVIGSIKAPPGRLAKAFLASVPVIFVLNLVRITFIAMADANEWFGFFPNLIGGTAAENSFFWVHNIFAEAGSLIALVVISYAVFRLLPETRAYIRDLYSIVTPKNILKNLCGERVVEARPLQRKY